MRKYKEGSLAPDWSCVDENGQLRTNQEFLGKKLALYFYPKDNTPGCINQACNLRDNYAELEKNGIVILGVSGDSEASHQKFKEKRDLPFPLLADVDKKLIHEFGVWGEKKFMGRIFDGLIRTTYLIDEKGIIQQIITKPKTKDHASEILEGFNLK
ncbi:MAG: thioredoxin-dependent thiol peroxidase [Bacteroidetes bacterium]|nr:thioredoxin-dependent thiol peroxidase [Bacteroidota bacterium]